MDEPSLRDTSKLLPEEIFALYYSRLCHFAFQLLTNKEEVEDIVQDAFVAFWNNRELVSENPIAIKNYLYTAVRNACYNLHRQAKVQERYLLIENPATVEESQVLNAMIRAEVMEEIYKAIDTLPEGCQRIFRLGYLEGISNPKIAEVLGISVNTVKTQKQRALKVLRANLKSDIFLAILIIQCSHIR